MEKAVAVRRRLDACAAAEAADSEVVHLGNDWEGVPEWQECARELPHCHEWLTNHEWLVGGRVDAHDIYEAAHLDRVERFLVGAVGERHTHPTRTARAHLFAFRPGDHSLADPLHTLPVLRRRRVHCFDVHCSEHHAGIPQERERQGEDHHDEAPVLRHHVVEDTFAEARHVEADESQKTTHTAANDSHERGKHEDCNNVDVQTPDSYVRRAAATSAISTLR